MPTKEVPWVPFFICVLIILRADVLKVHGDLDSIIPLSARSVLYSKVFPSSFCHGFCISHFSDLSPFLYTLILSTLLILRMSIPEEPEALAMANPEGGEEDEWGFDPTNIQSEIMEMDLIKLYNKFPIPPEF